MWVDLFPVLLAMAVSPVRTLAAILFLYAPRGVATALSFVLGMVVATLLQGVFVGVGLSAVGLTGSTRSSDLAVVVGTLYLAGGVILIGGAFKFATAPATGSGSLGSALERLERMEPRGSFKIGFGWMLASPKQWVFVLEAVAVIYTAELRPIGSVDQDESPGHGHRAVHGLRHRLPGQGPLRTGRMTGRPDPAATVPGRPGRAWHGSSAARRELLRPRRCHAGPGRSVGGSHR